MTKYVVDKLTLSEDHADWDYPSLSEPVRVVLAADVAQVLKPGLERVIELVRTCDDCAAVTEIEQEAQRLLACLKEPT